jgi:DNA (cytosine-5)-methyltransferase 1
MRFGSLFAGIGGLDLGFERAGFECAWQVEIDEFAQKILKKNFPHTRVYADVKEVHARRSRLCANCVAPVPYLVGGFPCQDISNAGRREGIEGAKSGLWSEFDRLIGEIQPEGVVMENVSALLVRGIDRVLGDLAARGYDAEWDCIPASTVGAYHQRDRVFICAYKVPDARRARLEGARLSWNPPERARWDPEPDICRVVDGLSGRLGDELRALGNAVVPQVAEHVARCFKDGLTSRGFTCS